MTWLTSFLSSLKYINKELKTLNGERALRLCSAAFASSFLLLRRREAALERIGRHDRLCAGNHGSLAGGAGSRAIRERRLERRAGGGLFGLRGLGGALGSDLRAWRLGFGIFGFAGAGDRLRARGGIAGAAKPHLASEAAKEASRIAAAPARRPRPASSGPVRRPASSRPAAARPATGRSMRRIDVGRNRAGQHGQGPQRQALPSPPSDSPVLPSGTLGGEHLVHAAVDAGIHPGDRRSLATSLAISASSCCCFSRTASASSSGIT